ncbi:MAG: AMP-binding protein [Actinomycetota bacterium]
MNLVEILEGQPDDDVALVSQSRETTYGELRSLVADFAAGLADRGVSRDDRVAVVAANNLDFVVSMFAALHVGAVAVPLNPRSPRPELASQIEVVGARAAVIGPGVAMRLSGTNTRAEDLCPDGVVIAPDAGALPGAIGRAELSGSTVDRCPRDEGDLAVLMFTSGTAGGPKAAMLSHGALLANQRQLVAMGEGSVSRDDTVLAVLPFSHIFGLNVVLGLGLAQGARLVLVENFDPVNAVETIRRHGVTMLPGVPPMFSSLLELAGLERDDLATLRRVSSGASALPPAVFDQFSERFGLTIAEGYGLTEACPVVTSSAASDAIAGAVGAPIPGVEVRLIDDEGEDALVGDPGEVWVKGPNLFSGYWREEEATRAVLGDDGWLRTGDIGVVDDDGNLYLVDRRKDVIIVSGFNVFPAEVEEVVQQLPAVREVAVVGVPHPHSGEAVVAHVVLEEGATADEDVVITFCEQRLPRYKCPSKVRFVPELPRSDSGKLARRLLVE